MAGQTLGPKIAIIKNPQMYSGIARVNTNRPRMTATKQRHRSEFDAEPGDNVNGLSLEKFRDAGNTQRMAVAPDKKIAANEIQSVVSAALAPFSYHSSNTQAKYEVQENS